MEMERKARPEMETMKIQITQSPQINQVPQFRESTPTIVLVTTIYIENEHLGIFTIPPNIRTPANKHDNSK